MIKSLIYFMFWPLTEVGRRRHYLAYKSTCRQSKKRSTRRWTSIPPPSWTANVSSASLMEVSSSISSLSLSLSHAGALFLVHWEDNGAGEAAPVVVQQASLHSPALPVISAGLRLVLNEQNQMQQQLRALLSQQKDEIELFLLSEVLISSPLSPGSQQVTKEFRNWF